MNLLANPLVRVAALVSLLTTLPACGLGTVGLASATGGSDGEEDDATLFTDFSITSLETSPAEVRYTLSDPDNQSLTVEIGYFDPGSNAFRQIAQRSLQVGEPKERTVPFPYGEPQHAFDENQLTTLEFALRIGGVVLDGVDDQGDDLNMRFTIGNTLPDVEAIEPPTEDDEQAGNVELTFRVSDESRHPVKVKVEYRVQGEGFQLARSVTENKDDPTPEYAFERLPTTSNGIPYTFRWETTFESDDERQLPNRQVDVEVRFTFTEIWDGEPSDTPESVSLLLDPFTVDNNLPPTGLINEGPLFVAADERRQVAITFRVLDNEGDTVAAIPQWRRLGAGGFQPLPGHLETKDDVIAYLTSVDPEVVAERRALGIMTVVPQSARGRITQAPSAQGANDLVRLPELAGDASWLAARGLDGSTLEILRTSQVPTSAKGGWTHPSAGLTTPVATLPLDDGVHALVLHNRPWRIHRVHLGTGQKTHLVYLHGTSDFPIGMVFEASQGSVLVSHEQASTQWSLTRITIDSEWNGNATTFYESVGGDARPLRGLVSLGTDAALVTAGNSLLHVTADATAEPLMEQLAEPWGIVRDPLHENRIFVAENSAPSEGGTGRVVAIQLGALGEEAVVLRQMGAPPGPGQGFERPEALALERSGARILVVTDDPGVPGHELRGVDLSHAGSASEVFTVATGLDAGGGGISTGSDGLRLVALPATNDLAVGGGVEQRREILGEPDGQVVRVSGEFAPGLSFADSGWRIIDQIRTEFPTTDDGSFNRFLWDSADVVGGGEVFLRVIPFDQDVGDTASTSAATTMRVGIDSPLCVTPGGNGQTNMPRAVVSADIDRDGLLDLVSANSEDGSGPGSVTIFLQTGTAALFDSVPTYTLLPNETAPNGARPRAVAVFDINGDGWPDVASANAGDDSLTVFYQVPEMGFPVAAPNETIKMGARLNTPNGVAIADIDGDGKPDLIGSNFSRPTGPNPDPVAIVFPQVNRNEPHFDGSVRVELGDFDVTGGASGLTIADVDGNGELDVITPNGTAQQPGSVTISYQVGGSFPNPGEPQKIDLPDSPPGMVANPRQVAVADFDKDGRLDFATANFGSSSVTFGLQRTLGAFELAQLGSASTTQTPFSVAAADLNGNGRTDLVSTNRNNNSLAVFFANDPLVADDGLFSTLPNLVLQLGDTPGGLGPQWVHTSDLNGDGLNDLSVASAFGQNLNIVCQSGPGQFPAKPHQRTGNTQLTQTPVALDVGDFDGDGNPDVISANRDSDSLTIFFTDGGGGLPDFPNVLLPTDRDGPPCDGEFFGPLSVEAIDLDGDGLLDVVAAVEGSDTESDDGCLAVFLQTAQGTMEPGPTVPKHEPDFTPVYVAAADFDEDGRFDLVTANYHEGTASNDLTVFRQRQTSGQFELLQELSAPELDRPRSLAIADLDGVSGLDIVSVNVNSSNLTIFYNDGTNNFPGPPVVLSDGVSSPAFVRAADLNADGRLDLAVANNGGDNVLVFLQGTSGFEAPQVLGMAGPPSSPLGLTVGDLNKDGQLDIATANRGRNNEFGNITVFFQTTPGRFSAVPDLVLDETGSNAGPGFILATDLDGDEELDLITAGGPLDNLRSFFGGH